MEMVVTESKAWNAAEWDYGALQADLQMASLWGALSQEEIVKRLQNIARRCPQFYPAILELGLRLLCQKKHRGAERMMEKGFRLMIELADPKQSAEIIDGVIENLERLWRFDIGRCLLEMLAKRYSLSAILHDSLAHAAARLGDLDAAQHHVGEAIRMERDNKNFWTNRGWYHLMRGELEEAGVALTEALRIKPKDSVAAGNMKILEYLRRHGGTYWDYLERPLDRKQIERLADQEKWDRETDLCTDFNDCRREAFAQSSLLKGGKERAQLPDLLATLRTFFDFVSQIDAGGIFLNEDIGLVHRNFKPIMHKFIFKFGDVDREMMEDVFEAMQTYYGFLATRRIVDTAEFTCFQAMILKTKDGLLDEMEQYNAVRHDATVSEKEKERLRGKLFEGDHLLPHI
jgi:tetratricopeptide (TPR) repeat protein